jgi:Tfp pilus assembly protein PilF
MTGLRYKILMLVGIMILTSCALITGKDQPAVQPPQSEGEKLLVKGIRSYEEGEYKNAAKNLQNALNTGLPRKTDSAKADKYLAFIACSSDNAIKCRDEFRKAFEDDPDFLLNQAEEVHPVWGPIYLEVRDRMKSKAR